MNTDDLFYKPYIEPTRNYHSDGVILSDTPDNTEQIEEDINFEEPEKAYLRNAETVERLLRIRKITPLLPERIVNTINTIIDTVIVNAWYDNENLLKPIIESGGKQIVIKKPPNPGDDDEEPPPYRIYFPPNPAKPDDEKPKIQQEEPSTYEIPTSGEHDEDDDYEWPEMTSSSFDIKVEENKNIWESAQEQYLLDQSLIREAFASEYNDIMERYVYQLLPVMDEVGISNPEVLNIEYEGETVSGIQENDMHLNDIIVRNQVAINDKSDLFAKTHNLYQTSAVLSSFDVISQERVRYSKERYKESLAETYLDIYDKNLLAGIRDEYERKYRTARANVYKFLHSAAILSADMLMLALDSNIAKCSLIKKGINIFVKKEYENEEFSNSTENKSKKSDSKDTSNKATDTTDKKDDKDKENKSDIKTDSGTSKNAQEKTKDAAGGETKTVTENNKTKVKVNASAKNAEQKKKQEGEQKPQ